MAPTWGKLDIIGALKITYITPIMTLLFLNMFDTIGTLIGVSEQAGILKNGKLPRAGNALMSDAIGTTFGAVRHITYNQLYRKCRRSFRRGENRVS